MGVSVLTWLPPTAVSLDVRVKAVSTYHVEIRVGQGATDTQ